MPTFYKVSFEIEANKDGIEFLRDLIHSETLNTRDNEEGRIAYPTNLTIQRIER